MKKFLSLVLALVMALSLTTVAFGANVTVTYDNSLTAEQNGKALHTAIKNAADGDTITVGAGTYYLTNGDTSRFNLSNKSVTIVGAGEDVTILQGERYGVVLQDNVNPDSTTTYTLKNMTIESVGTGAAVYAKDDTTVNLENVTLKTQGNTAILLDSCNDIAGGFHDGVETVVNATNVTIEDGKKVEIVANPVSSIPNAGVMSYGSVNIGSGNNFDAADVQPQGNLNLGLGNLNVNSEIINPGVAVVDGKHYATVQEAVDAAAVSGSDVVLWPTTASSATIPDGYQSLKLTDGTSVVVPAVTSGDKFDLYLADDGMATALKLGAEDVAGLSFNEVGAKTYTDGSGRVAYIAANNGEFFVKTTSPVTTSYAVTYAGKTDVLYYVNLGPAGAGYYEYSDTCDVVTEFGVKCGQCAFINTAYTANPLKTYFVLADEETVCESKAAVADPQYNFLVNGVVYSAEIVGKIVDHAFTANDFDYNATLKQNVPSSAICTKCLATSTAIYLDGKVPANLTYYDIANATAYSVVLNGAPVKVPTTPSTDVKVESAETFDAGIAMYVGMSVLAATGSVVVLKKRED